MAQLWGMRNSKKELANILFMDTELDQKEIAAHVGVSEQTLSKWAKENDWRQQKAVDTLSPDKLVREFYQQSYAIAQRAKDEDRSLTPAEADSLVKLASAIEKLDKKVSPSITMAVLIRMNNWLKLVDPALTKQLIPHQMEYVQALIKEKQ